MFMSKDKRLHSGRSINTGADPCASPARSFPAPSVPGCHPDGSAPPATPIPALFRQPRNMELDCSQVLSPTPVPGVVREVQEAQCIWLEGLGLGDRCSRAKGRTLHGLGSTVALHQGGLQGDVLELPLLGSTTHSQNHEPTSALTNTSAALWSCSVSLW